MKKEITDIDPNEHSNEVQESLVKEGVFEEEKAKEYADSVWFEEADTGESTKKGIVSCLRSMARHKGIVSYLRSMARDGKEDGKEVISRLRWFFSDYKTVFANIESVERTDNDKVKLHIGHERLGTKTSKLYPPSNKLANLLEWKGVDNPFELEGSRIPILRKSLYMSPTNILIPHNVSTSGLLRFFLYNGVEEVRVKTRMSGYGDNLETTDLVFLIGSATSAASLILLLPGFILGMELLSPILILTLILVTPILTPIFYWLLRFFLYTLSRVLHSDYFRKYCE